MDFALENELAAQRNAARFAFAARGHRDSGRIYMAVMMQRASAEWHAESMFWRDERTKR